MSARTSTHRKKIWKTQRNGKFTFLFVPPKKTEFLVFHQLLPSFCVWAVHRAVTLDRPFSPTTCFPPALITVCCLSSPPPPQETLFVAREHAKTTNIALFQGGIPEEKIQNEYLKKKMHHYDNGNGFRGPRNNFRGNFRLTFFMDAILSVLAAVPSSNLEWTQLPQLV